MQKNGITTVICPRSEAHITEQIARNLDAKITEKRPGIRSEIWRFFRNFGILKRKKNRNFALQSGVRKSGLDQGAARERRHLYLIFLMQKNG